MEVPFEGVVAHCSRLNVRMAPSVNVDIVDVITEGTRVDVQIFLKEPITGQGDWYEIAYRPGGYPIKHGFVRSEYIEPIVE